MNAMSETCKKIIFSGGFSQYKNVCGKPAKFEVDGKHFCGIHNPNKAETKAQIQAKENRNKQRAVWRLNAAAPDLLEALIEIMSWEDNDRMTWADKARAAIAKATGQAS